MSLQATDLISYVLGHLHVSAEEKSAADGETTKTSSNIQPM